MIELFRILYLYSYNEHIYEPINWPRNKLIWYERAHVKDTFIKSLHAWTPVYYTNVFAVCIRAHMGEYA